MVVVAILATFLFVHNAKGELVNFSVRNEDADHSTDRGVKRLARLGLGPFSGLGRLLTASRCDIVRR